MQNLLVAMINAQNHSQKKEVKSKSFRFGDEDINWFQSMISLDDHVFQHYAFLFCHLPTNMASTVTSSYSNEIIQKVCHAYVDNFLV